MTRLRAIVGESHAASYAKLQGHKVMVDLPERKARIALTATYSSMPVDNPAAPQLESCQITYNTPCYLIAIDNHLVANGPNDPAARHSMPRVQYSGPFRPGMVPFFHPSKYKDLQGYANRAGPKAIALRTILGAKIAVAGGRDLREAQANALRECNDEKVPFPCFIYAVNNTVVLPQRITEARP
jgi:hypothetical protein